MKKITLIFAFAILNLYTFAQDYISIKQEYIAHFESYKAIRIDSVTTSGDTIRYHNFRMIRHDVETDCYNRFGASWTGQSIMILPNGENLFVNKASDTITIKTNAVLGEEWLLYNYPDDRYITASISNYDTLSFLSVNDSVKTISLQVKDAEGNNIEDAMNNRYLKLSKNYGFVRILDFYEFPFENYESFLYEFQPVSDIIGINDLGYQNYGVEEIFDFDIGDELHIHEIYGNYVEYTGLHYEYILKVIERTNFTNGVTYTFDKCFRESFFDMNNPENDYTTFTHDTIEETYDFLSPNLQFLNNLLFEPYSTAEFQWSFIREKSDCIDSFVGDDLNCMGMVILELPYFCNNYKKGLGGPYYYVPNTGDYYIEKSLVYYKKGETEWGNPYYCGQLASINDIQTASSIKIYPNPAKDFIIIEQNITDNKQHRITISNISGKNVLQTTSDAQLTRINVAHLKEGVYFVTVNNGKSSFSGKFIKIK